MRIVFASDALRDECNNQDLLVKRLGADRARLVRQRLDELFNAEVLADMRAMPHVSFLDDAPQGALAIDVGNPYRIVFQPARPAEADGGWDWRKVDSIRILALTRSR